MNFTYETQGAATYLVCELSANEQIDSLTLGMLTNNHITGVAPVIYTEMNDQKYLKYNISAKITANQFFGGNSTKQRTLNAFSNILNTICSADEYMIDPNCFVVEPENVYLNVSNCETALICLPVIGNNDINAGIKNLFTSILGSLQLSNEAEKAFVSQIDAYINEDPTFSIYGLKDLVDKLNSTNGVSAQPQMSAPQTQFNGQPIPVASAFDSTISIDDMPKAMAGQSFMPPPVQPQPQMFMPAQPAQPQQPPQQQMFQAVPPQQPPQQQMFQAVPPQQPPVRPGMNGGMPVPPLTPGQPEPPKKTAKKSLFGSKSKSEPVAPATPPVIPGKNNGAFAIPNRPVAVPPATPAADSKKKEPKAKKSDDENGEKKMSLFGLLAHYNKENVELYKAQKEAASKQKKEKEVKPQQQIPGAPNQGSQPIPNGNQMGNNGMPQFNQPNVVPGGVFPPQQPQYQQSVQQPVPVQTSFNETTVLSAFGGETTVLSATPESTDPYLVRIKTGEKIYINKPVFRIGKEKSYVDYFIADNTAISRSHCNIHIENGEYFIEDTNSTNHTYINGVVINSNIKTKLTSGDKVKLANEEFTFSV